MVFVFCGIDLLAELDCGIIREAQVWPYKLSLSV